MKLTFFNNYNGEQVKICLQALDGTAAYVKVVPVIVPELCTSLPGDRGYMSCY